MVHPNTPQIIKKTMLVRLQLRFGLIFNALWRSVSIKLHDVAESLKLQHVYCEMLVFASLGLPFWHRKSIPKFNVFQDACLSTFWMIICSF